jgi:hypothetical protein
MFRYICCAQKKALEYKLKISKRKLVRFAFFAALIGAAFFFDLYFENHPVELEEIENVTEQNSGEYRIVCLFNFVNASSAKIPIFKVPSGKLWEQSHNKLIQKYHEARNYQVLKTEAITPRKPFILSCHHLTFRHNSSLSPGDDPLSS